MAAPTPASRTAKLVDQGHGAKTKAGSVTPTLQQRRTNSGRCPCLNKLRKLTRKFGTHAVRAAEQDWNPTCAACGYPQLEFMSSLLHSCFCERAVELARRRKWTATCTSTRQIGDCKFQRREPIRGWKGLPGGTREKAPATASAGTKNLCKIASAPCKIQCFISRHLTCSSHSPQRSAKEVRDKNIHFCARCSRGAFIPRPLRITIIFRTGLMEAARSHLRLAMQSESKQAKLGQRKMLQETEPHSSAGRAFTQNLPGPYKLLSWNALGRTLTFSRPCRGVMLCKLSFCLPTQENSCSNIRVVSSSSCRQTHQNC